MKKTNYKSNFLKKIYILLLVILLILLLNRDINLNRVKANCKDTINKANKGGKHISKCNIIKEKYRENNFAMPVIIAKKQFDIFVESYIDFQDEAIEIKEIKNDLILTDEKLINMGNNGTLFLSGVIKTKIEYIIFDSAKDNAFFCKSKYAIINSQFNKAINIDYFKSPKIFKKNCNLCEYKPTIQCNLIKADFCCSVSSSIDNVNKYNLNIMKSLKLRINSNVQIDLTQLQNVNM